MGRPHDEHLGRSGGRVRRHLLTTGLRAANAFNLTRIDLPFLLGTAFTSNRTRAKAYGYGAHFINGQIFALIYYAVFAAIGYSSWWLGCLFGLVHGLFAATALVNILLPLVHPRIGDTRNQRSPRRPARTTRLPHAQLRPRHAHRHPRRPPRLRHHHRKLPRLARLNASRPHRAVLPADGMRSRPAAERICARRGWAQSCRSSTTTTSRRTSTATC